MALIVLMLAWYWHVRYTPGVSPMRAGAISPRTARAHQLYRVRMGYGYTAGVV